jgi:hypothetical protein
VLAIFFYLSLITMLTPNIGQMVDRTTNPLGVLVCSDVVNTVVWFANRFLLFLGLARYRIESRTNVGP